ncbi:unknown [Sutterella sp. CAG:397]|nr:unknown [Sutterella sp. CAG:397]
MRRLVILTVSSRTPLRSAGGASSSIVSGAMRPPAALAAAGLAATFTVFAGLPSITASSVSSPLSGTPASLSSEASGAGAGASSVSITSPGLASSSSCVSFFTGRARCTNVQKASIAAPSASASLNHEKQKAIAAAQAVNTTKMTVVPQTPSHGVMLLATYCPTRPPAPIGMPLPR